MSLVCLFSLCFCLFLSLKATFSFGLFGVQENHLKEVALEDDLFVGGKWIKGKRFKVGALGKPCFYLTFGESTHRIGSILFPLFNEMQRGRSIKYMLEFFYLFLPSEDVKCVNCLTTAELL